MCGRYATHTQRHHIEAHYDLQLEGAFSPQYNIAPTMAVPTVLFDGGQRTLRRMHWGLLPSWAKDRAFASKTFNARSETAHEKPAFRSSFKRRRCLLPASGYYEWRKTEQGKQPYYIYVTDPDGQPAPVFSLAGLWSTWTDPDSGEVVESCTILTTSANPFTKPLHHRMPVLLDGKDYEEWLDPSHPDPGELRRLFEPYPGDRMDLYPVSKAVNNVRNQGEELLEPLDESAAGDDTDGPEQMSLL